MDENKFKKINKPPACTLAPWYDLIPENIRYDTMRKIRQETIAEYGYSMDECPKRLVCFTKQCIGRPLPWKSETAKPYLEKLKTTHRIMNDEMFISGCEACPIAKKCSKPCQQVENFMSRHNKQEPSIIIKENLDSYVDQPFETGSLPFDTSLEIPWDVLTTKRQQIVKAYLFDNKDFESIAKDMKMYNQAAAKYAFYSALTKLSEYGTMRKFITDKEGDLTYKQRVVLSKIYVHNYSLHSVAKEVHTTKQAIYQMVKRVIDKHGLKWQIFVTKKGNKVQYNVPQLLK